MKMLRKHPFLTWTLTAVFAITWLQSQGQSSVYEYGNRSSVRLELNKPIFEDAEDIGFFTLGNYLNVQFPLNEKLAISGEIPFAFASFDDESESSVGNIKIALNYYSTSQKFKLHFGIGIPSASDNEASFVGLFVDPTERYTAFFPDVLPLSLIANFYDNKESGFLYRVRTGFELAIAQEDYLETELLFQFTPLIGYAFNGGEVKGGFSALANLTDDDFDFSDSVISTIILASEFDAGHFRPGIVVRIPLDEDLTDFLSLTFGLSLGYTF